jgi:hypothetical protein
MSRPFRTPTWAIVLGWIVTVGFLAAYDFIVHASFRGMIPAFGFQLGPFLQAFFGTVVMALFVVWLVTLAELPEMWFAHRLPVRRYRAGRCPNCGHPRGDAPIATCPECGHDLEVVPVPYTLGLSAVRRFAIALGLGLVIGVIAAELSIAADESRMRDQSAACIGTELTFHRAWPATFARVRWSPEHGLKPLPLMDAWNWPD